MSGGGLTWIKHDGGPMPVPGDTIVAYKMGSDIVYPGHYYRELDGEPAGRLVWGACGASTITEYAIVKASRSAGVVVEDQDDEYGRATLTGGSSPYYTIDVNGTAIECNDIIKALGLPYADGNVLKAVWRIAMDRMGKGKPGNTRLYDAEKIVFFGNDIVERERGA